MLICHKKRHAASTTYQKNAYICGNHKTTKGTAYVNEKGNQGRKSEHREPEGRNKFTETDAIDLVQLKHVSERKWDCLRQVRGHSRRKKQQKAGGQLPSSLLHY